MQEKLEKYAELILKKGVNIQKDQPLLIIAPIESIPFVRILAKRAYELQVRDIDFCWEDPVLEHDQLCVYDEQEILRSRLFQRDQLEECCKKGGAVIFLEGPDPDALKDIQSSKIAAATKARLLSQPTARKKRSTYEFPWVIAAVVTENWAEKLFPEESDRSTKLWNLIFDCCLIHEDDPLVAWDQKAKRTEQQKEWLNQLHLKTIHYQNSLGTDLTVTLNEDSIWEGALSQTPNGRELLVNIPSEEVFTSPNYHETSGIVFSSKPLVYEGNIIDQFSLKFEKGKVVEVHAKEGEEILKGILATDPQASFLGEVALVEYDSPISNSQILFYTTLFDENAACHLALGSGFPTTIQGGEKLKKEELLKRGVNESDVHVDFMIGTKDLKITGTDFDGVEHCIFENGNFVKNVT